MNIVKAGAEELIWLVVGIFWVIAQIAGSAAKKKKTPSRPVTGEKSEAPADPFTDLMRKLSGGQEFKTPQPPEPEKTPDETTAWYPEMARRHGLHEKAIKTPPAPPPVVLAKKKPAEEPSNASEVDIRPTLSAFRNTLPSMKLPSIKLHFQCATHHDRGVDSGKDIGRAAKLDLKNRTVFRRAMLSHIILGRPKALGG